MDDNLVVVSKSGCTILTNEFEFKSITKQMSVEDVISGSLIIRDEHVMYLLDIHTGKKVAIEGVIPDFATLLSDSILFMYKRGHEDEHVLLYDICRRKIISEYKSLIDGISGVSVCQESGHALVELCHEVGKCWMLIMNVHGSIKEVKSPNISSHGYKIFVTRSDRHCQVYSFDGTLLWHFFIKDAKHAVMSVCTSFAIEYDYTHFHVIKPTGSDIQVPAGCILYISDDYILIKYNTTFIKVDSDNVTEYKGRLLRDINSRRSDYILVSVNNRIEFRDFRTFNVVHVRPEVSDIFTIDTDDGDNREYTVFRIPRSPEFIDTITKVVSTMTNIPISVSKIIAMYS